MEEVILNVLKVDQPIGEFYIGAIRSETLNQISTVDIRKFNENDPDDIAGIQRTLSKDRVKQISQYVNFEYATFPTSIVIAVDERCATLESVGGCEGLFRLIIRPYEGDDDDPGISIERAAFIIDGQHRLAGLRNLQAGKTFEVNVSIFVGADLADKAEIFSTVNLAQTKVNKSLVYDLYTYAEKPSPVKAAHEVTIALNRDPNGPFFRKIKRLGTATPGIANETLAQATVVNAMLKYLPRNPDKEKNKGFFDLFSRAEEDEDWKTEIFAPFYRENDTVSIFRILNNYFGAVQKRWPSAWNDNERGLILNRTNGYVALMRLLRDCYNQQTASPRVVDMNEFMQFFERVELKDSDFNTDNFKPGSSGASALYKTLHGAAIERKGNQLFTD